MKMNKWIITTFGAVTLYTLIGTTNLQVEAATYNSVKITATVLNVRSGSSVKNNVIAKIKKGQTFRVYTRKKGWVQIQINGKKGWITTQYTVNTSTQKKTTSRSNTRSGAAVAVFAKDQLGKKYVWGATGSSTFDCSGFTLYVMKNFGVNLNRTAASQSSNGVKVSRSDLQTGDLVFFRTNRNGISHVGIYIGGGQFIHASSAAGKVTISSMRAGYYDERFVTACRVIR